MLEYSLSHMADNTATFFIIALYYKVITCAIKKTTDKVMPGGWVFILTFMVSYFTLYHFLNFDLFVFIKDMVGIIIYTFFVKDITEVNKIAEWIFRATLLLFLIIYIPTCSFNEPIRPKNLITNKTSKKQSQQDTGTANTPHNNKYQSEELQRIISVRLALVITVILIIIYLFQLL